MATKVHNSELVADVVVATDFALLVKLRDNLLGRGYVDDAEWNQYVIDQEPEMCRIIQGSIYTNALVIHGDNVVSLFTENQIQPQDRVVYLTADNYEYISTQMFLIQ